MENLEQNINKTDTLKNDLKLARNKINERILSGGGTRANTISEIPSKIDEMLGQYKKVATGTAKTNQNSGNERFEFPLNLDFTPTRIMLVVTKFYYTNKDISGVHDTYPNGWLDSDLKDRRVSMNLVLIDGSVLSATLKLISFDSDKLIITTETIGSDPNNKMTINWIAIG